MYIDFVKMREQMVEGQLRPLGITDQAVLDALKAVPREHFVEKNLRRECYRENLYYTDNTRQRFLLPPTIFGKMLQALTITPTDIALDVGCGTGYHSAVLGALCDTVLAIDSKPDYVDLTHRNCGRHDMANIVPQHVTDYWTQTADKAPFDIIFIGGSIQGDVPQSILQQLSPHGRLATILMETATLGKAVLITRYGKDFITKPITECSAPLIDKTHSHDFIF